MILLLQLSVHELIKQFYKFWEMLIVLTEDNYCLVYTAHI